MPSKNKEEKANAFSSNPTPVERKDRNTKNSTAPDYPDLSSELKSIESEELLNIEWTSRDSLVRLFNYFSALCYGIEEGDKKDNLLLSAKEMITCLSNLSSSSDEQSLVELSSKELGDKIIQMPILSLDKKTRQEIVMQLAKNQGLLSNSLELSDDIKKRLIDENQNMVLKLHNLKFDHFLPVLKGK